MQTKKADVAETTHLQQVPTSSDDVVALGHSPELGRLIIQVIEEEEVQRDLVRQQELAKMRELARYD